MYKPFPRKINKVQVVEGFVENNSKQHCVQQCMRQHAHLLAHICNGVISIRLRIQHSLNPYPGCSPRARETLCWGKQIHLHELLAWNILPLAPLSSLWCLRPNKKRKPNGTRTARDIWEFSLCGAAAAKMEESAQSHFLPSFCMIFTFWQRRLER